MKEFHMAEHDQTKEFFSNLTKYGESHYFLPIHEE